MDNELYVLFFSWMLETHQHILECQNSDCELCAAFSDFYDRHRGVIDRKLMKYALDEGHPIHKEARQYCQSAGLI